MVGGVRIITILGVSAGIGRKIAGLDALAGVAIAILIGVGVVGALAAEIDRGVRIVTEAITVFIKIGSITNFGGGGVDRREAVVTICVIRNIARRRTTGILGGGGIAIAVIVPIFVPSGGIGGVTAIGLAITVIVDTVTDFLSTGVDAGIPVITLLAGGVAIIV